jgi:hypothetical protein
MTKRECKKAVREVFEAVDIDQIHAMTRVATLEYCHMRISECTIKGDYAGVLQFSILLKVLGSVSG